MLRCPAVHVPDGARASSAELEPIVAYVGEHRAAPCTRRFSKGTVQSDGRLDFCKQGLGASGTRAVVGALGSGHPWLKHLLLGTNYLGDEGARVLGEAIGAGLAVETLYLGCNGIGSDGASALARSLETNPHVQALWLKRNAIGERGLFALLEALPHTSLRTLDLTNCALGDEGVQRVLATLAQSPSKIRHLFLGGNGLCEAGILAEWLASPQCALQTLFLPASRLGERGAATLFQALATNRSLRSLDLSSNALGVGALEEAARLADFIGLPWLNLGVSPATEALGESVNDVTDAAVPHLVRLCEGSLRHLGLKETAITSRGARELLTRVESRATIVFGRGVARTLRQRGKARESASPSPPRDVRHIASVYR